MKTSRFWKPIIISLAATPICLYISVVSTGGGHSFFLPKILFPYAMLSISFFKSITVSILLAVIEIPFYSAILARANAKDEFLPLAVKISVVHILAVIASFLFSSESLS
jgi:hypothetical protein